MKHLNIEIKAKCTQHEKIRDILISHKAIFKGTDHQIDTYFNSPNGRLKLREGTIENHLIFYKRENSEGPKQSDVTLYNSTPHSSLKSILELALGVLTVVDKTREIYFIDNVKFHIDTVKDLGTFMEIEAIATNGDIKKEQLLEQCMMYQKLFDIKETDLLSGSYSDMLLPK